MNPYRKIFVALQKAKIKYLIVGGVAVNLYGYSRFTGDIDILIALDKENLKKMSSAMKRLGYMQRLPVDLLNLDILVGYSFEFRNFLKKEPCSDLGDESSCSCF